MRHLHNRYFKNRRLKSSHRFGGGLKEFIVQKLFQEVEGKWKGVKSRLGRAGEVNVETKGEGAGVAQKRDSKSVKPRVRIL